MATKEDGRVVAAAARAFYQRQTESEKQQVRGKFLEGEYFTTVSNNVNSPLSPFPPNLNSIGFPISNCHSSSSSFNVKEQSLLNEKRLWALWSIGYGNISYILTCIDSLREGYVRSSEVWSDRYYEFLTTAAY